MAVVDWNMRINLTLNIIGPATQKWALQRSHKLKFRQVVVLRKSESLVLVTLVFRAERRAAMRDTWVPLPIVTDTLAYRTLTTHLPPHQLRQNPLCWSEKQRENNNQLIPHESKANTTPNIRSWASYLL